MIDVTRCLKVMDRADELAIKLYEEADNLTDSSIRRRSHEYATLLETSANVIRELADALRVAAVLALHDDHLPRRRGDEC